jgi:uncharacterized protein YutE (UPF0331/DUF86 family)
MTMETGQAFETELLESMVPRLASEGFEVFIHPSPSILPPFMRDYRPDAIALRADKKIAIEIKRSGKGSASQARQLKKLFSEHKEWELRFYYAEPRSAHSGIEVESLPAIQSVVEELRKLRDANLTLSALLVGWSALEAVARALLPQRLVREQTSIKLIEALASEGWLTPDEADDLRGIATLRNAAAHGQLTVPIDTKHIDELMAILQTLTELLTNGGSAD